MTTRMVGFLCRDSGLAAHRLSGFMDDLDEATRGDFVVLSHPANEPVVAVAVSQTSLPSVQTAVSADGSFAVVDGVFHNAAEIWRGDGDTETGNDAEQLLGAYRRQGGTAFDDLDASAVCAIWDAADRKLLLSRDTIGNVPGFYAIDEEGLVWSSDLSSVVAVTGAAEIDRASLDQYLGAGFVPSPMTMFASIRSLQPAELLEVSGQGDIKSRCCWRPTGRPRLRLSVEETTEELNGLFDRALMRRFDATRKSAVLLSGGVDSKLVLAYLANRDGANVKSYTFEYGDYSGRLNESDLAKACADHFGIKHQIIPFGPDDVVKHLERMIGIFGEPFSYGLHTVMLDDICAAGVSDVFCGIGADGWFLGAPDTRAVRYLNLPWPVRALVVASIPLLEGAASVVGGGGLSSLAGRLRSRSESFDMLNWRAGLNLPPLVSGAIFQRRERKDMYRDRTWVGAARERIDEVFASHIEQFDGETEEDLFRFMSLRFFAGDQMLNWTHWSARAYPLTISSPFNDREILEFVHRMPMYQLGKPELRRLAATRMPHDMAYGPKIAQGVPLADWMRGGMREFVSDILAPSRVADSGIFSVDKVTKLLAQHMSGEFDHAWRVWAVLSVLLWQDNVKKWQGRRA